MYMPSLDKELLSIVQRSDALVSKAWKLLDDHRGNLLPNCRLPPSPVANHDNTQFQWIAMT